ncbi:MAG TPA: response regulator [Gaiellaceae bacterium]|nr:response regulator [Gaiellaceae bacterium]
MEPDGVPIGERLFGAAGAPRVLIAEDEPIVRLDLAAILRANGFDVCAEARDGEESVELARELRPDAAVLDIRMPVLDGVEAARRIYAERPLPIVMLTAYSERQTVERAIAAGAFTYLVKPFTETDVIPALRAAMARHGDLLHARRRVGAGSAAVEVEVPSRGGGTWPLRLVRTTDGTTRVTLAPEEGR